MGRDASAGLIVEVFAGGKAASPATPDAWAETGSTQTINSTNLLDSNDDRIVVTGFVALPGIELPPPERLPFVMRPVDEELRRCMRYFQYVSSPEETSLYVLPMAFGKAATSIWDSVGYNFPVPMRTVPIFEHSSPSSINLVGVDHFNRYP